LKKPGSINGLSRRERGEGVSKRRIIMSNWGRSTIRQFHLEELMATGVQVSERETARLNSFGDGVFVFVINLLALGFREPTSEIQPLPDHS